MQWYRKHMIIYTVLIVLALLFAVVISNVLIIKNNGTHVAVPDIPREAQSVGAGKPLNYLILGDSTGVGQGGNYDKGIATLTAQHIAGKGYEVEYQNFAISGATVNDVLTKQLDKALATKPEVVLLPIGANDVTHLTRLKKVEIDMRAVVAKLKAANPNVKIIITGSPQMGSVPRFPQPIKTIAKWRTAQINKVFERIAADPNVTFAHIADQTGKTFLEHPEYFAADKFHPLDKGYAVWVPILNAAIDKTL